MSKEPTKGFLIAASKTRKFYQLAINCIESIKDFYPESKVCLFTEEYFLDGRETIADYVVPCGPTIREKLWALEESPFDITMYIDADCEVVHEDIQNTFDQLKDYDMVFTKIDEKRERFFAYRTWPGGSLKLNGGVILYDKRKPIVKELLKDWNNLYKLQKSLDWWPDYTEDGKPDFDKHPEWMSAFDQFTLWWLTEKNPKYKDLKIGFFDEDVRWNWYSKFTSEVLPPSGKSHIIYHLSGGVDKGVNDYD